MSKCQPNAWLRISYLNEKIFNFDRNPSNLIQNLNEIEWLRSQLLKTTALAQSKKPISLETENPNKPRKNQLASASSDNLLTTFLSPLKQIGVFTTPIELASSSSSSSSCQWTPNTVTVGAVNGSGDSGMESQKSDAAGNQGIARPATRASSIPRPVHIGYSSYSSSSRSSPVTPNHRSSSANIVNSSIGSSATIMSDEHVYSGYSRDELVQLVRQLASENVIIKRQIGSTLFLIFNKPY